MIIGMNLLAGYLFFTILPTKRKRTIVFKISLMKSISLQDQLREQALRDPLTGCFNRRYLDEMLARESSRADRTEITIGLVMLDIDHFKVINDTYGHITGDQVLQAIGNTLQEKVCLGDIVCRYGGEEFLIVFPGSHSNPLSNVLRHYVTRSLPCSFQPLPTPQQHVTASMGVAMYPIHGKAFSKSLNMSIKHYIQRNMRAVIRFISGKRQ